MKPNQIVPILANLGPAAAFAPQVLAGVAIGLGLLWLFSDKEETSPVQQAETPIPARPAEVESDAPLRTAKRRIKREDLAEALAYGARRLTRQEAVAALQALGFKKTAAYKALSPDGRFGAFLEHSPDGLIEWQG
jgi:hypothetical protein